MTKSEVKRILDIVADLAHNDVKKDVLETEIISHSGLTAVEVRNYLYELEWQNLVKEGLPRPRHAEFRLWTITEKGLQDRSRQDQEEKLY
jgi:predicted transcriptional regulator